MRLVRVLIFLGATLALAQDPSGKPSGDGAPGPQPRKTKAQKMLAVPPEVTLGRPFVRGYRRLYPLLDGIFQDVSSTQLSPLTLTPNAANGASLNAVLNAFQLGVSYSATAGAQNATAQQLNSTLGAGAGVQSQLLGLQSQLLTQQAQLVQSAVTAQQQVGAAQTQLDVTKQPGATSDQTAAATQALTAATDNLNSINAQLKTVSDQLTAIKGQLNSPGTLQSLTSTAPGAQQSPPTLPTQLTQLTAPPGAPSSPSFPSTKQMDNQINLLWERLSRVVGTLTLPDSLEAYKVDLAQIDVGITPFERKHQLLGVQYHLACTDPAKGTPVLLDLFPSASAVNIVDTKYKESRSAFTAVLSWFAAGLNTSYNRDHLLMSQTLGQSAYITGYGIGEPDFGWIFGKNMGDDTVSPGNRRLFALIAAPGECDTFSIQATRAQWFRENEDDWRKKVALLPGDSRPPTYDLASGREVGRTPAKSNQIVSVSYAPVEYDPANPGKTLVTVEINTDSAIDPQQSVSVNGRVMKRSRDTFGRAVNATGAGGLLETTTLDPNSWIPISDRSFVLTLDPSAFGRAFPDIQVAAPLGYFSLASAISAKAAVQVSGRTLTYGSLSDLPPLGFPTCIVRQVLISHWHGKDSGGKESLLITQAVDPASTTNAGGGAPATLQVVSYSDTPAWGGDTFVLAGTGASAFRLSCQTKGLRLQCDPPKDGFFDGSFNLTVVDIDHPGGPMRAQLSLEPCAGDDCKKPLVWTLGRPEWLADAGSPIAVHLAVDLINVPQNQLVQLLGGASGNILVDSQTCFAFSGGICSVQFSISQRLYSNVTDTMALRFGALVDSPRATLKNLRSITQPLVTSVNDPQTIFTGQNLYFAKLQVEDGSKPLDMACSGGAECRIKSYPDTVEGYIAFLDADSNPLDALLLKPGATSAVPIYHTALKKETPAPTAKGGKGAKSGVAPPQPPPPQKPAAAPTQKFSLENSKNGLYLLQ